MNQFKRAAHSIGVAVEQARTRTDAEIATTFRQLASDWQAQVRRLATLKPPSKLAFVFNIFIAAAGRVETDLRSVVAAATTHSQAAATQAGSSLVSDILAAKAAATKITQRLGIR